MKTRHSRRSQSPDCSVELVLSFPIRVPTHFPHIYCLIQKKLKDKGLVYGAGVICCSSLYAAQKYYGPKS